MSTLKAENIQSITTGPPIFKTSAGTEAGQLAKAWVNFNGTGTVAIRDDFNVSSITDHGTGEYTLHFTTEFANTNYAECFGMSGDTNGGNLIRSYLGSSEINKTTSSVRIQSLRAENNDVRDCACITGSFFAGS